MPSAVWVPDRRSSPYGACAISIIDGKSRRWNQAVVLWLLLKPGLCRCAKSSQSCPTVCNCMDCNPPGFSAHRILQARILEWVAMPFSRGSSQPVDWTWDSCVSYVGRDSLPQVPAGKPHSLLTIHWPKTVIWLGPLSPWSFYGKLVLSPSAFMT